MKIVSIDDVREKIYWLYNHPEEYHELRVDRAMRSWRRFYPIASVDMIERKRREISAGEHWIKP